MGVVDGGPWPERLSTWHWLRRFLPSPDPRVDRPLTPEEFERLYTFTLNDWAATHDDDYPETMQGGVSDAPDGS